MNEKAYTPEEIQEVLNDYLAAWLTDEILENLTTMRQDEATKMES